MIIIEYIVSSPMATFSTILVLIGTVCLVHVWTVKHHHEHKTPNWTLLQLCNYLCVFLFFTSIFQIFSRSSPLQKPSPVWGLICLFCLVYFFSIFGVWFVHALLLVGEEEEQESQFNINAQCNREKEMLNQSPSLNQTMRDLRVANERLGAARNEHDVWGVLEILWRLTNSGVLNVHLIQETHVGRTLGSYCKRTCGRCNSPDCDFCDLMATWKHMVWEITTKQNPNSINNSGQESVEKNSSLPNRPKSPMSNGLRSSQKLPSIPEFREHTNSTESSNGELEYDLINHQPSRKVISTNTVEITAELRRSRDYQRP